MSMKCVCVCVFLKLSYWNYHLTLKIIIYFLLWYFLMPLYDYLSFSLSLSHSTFIYPNISSTRSNLYGYYLLLFEVWMMTIQHDFMTESKVCVYVQECFYFFLLPNLCKMCDAAFMIRWYDFIAKINERINYLQRFFFITHVNIIPESLCIALRCNAKPIPFKSIYCIMFSSENS